MNRRILIFCVAALLGVFISVTLLGKRILPGAPIHKAWIVPLGSTGWQYVMMDMAVEGLTRSALTDMLGNPDGVSVSTWHTGRVYLHYTNPHDSGRDVSFAISKEGRVSHSAPGEKLPMTPP